MEKFYGKYRAIATRVNDPEHRGRIRVRCPRIYGEGESPWCLPCVPFLSDDLPGMPEKGEGVWIEFEEGNPRYPIWVGGWL